MSVAPSYNELLQDNINLKRHNRELNMFQAVFHAADNGIALLNGIGQFLDVNAALCATLGHTRKELLQMKIMDLPPSELLTLLGKNYTHVKKQKTVFNDTIILRKERISTFLELQTSLLQPDDSSLIQIISQHSASNKQKEELLQLYEQLFSITQDLVAFVDTSYIYQMVNKRYSRDHDKRRDEIIGKSVADLLGKKVFSEVVKPQIDRCFAGEIVRYQAWFDFPGSGRRYRDVTYSPHRLSNGSVSGTVVVSHDLTDLKLAKEQCDFNKKRLENILLVIPDGVYIVNQEYNIEYINPVLEKEFGTVKGRKCYQYLHNRTQPCVYCENKNIFAGIPNYRTWHSLTHNKHYEIFESPLENADGTLTKVTFFHDLTQEKKAKEKLKNNQVLLDGIINNSSTIIYVKDTHGKYLITNTRFNELFHKNAQEIIGKTVFDLPFDKQAHTLQRHDNMVLESKLISQFEETMYHDDSYHVYLSIKFPLFDTDDSVYAVAGISTDITDYKQLELELRDNNTRLNALINTSPDTICFKDGDGKWLLANEAGLQLFQLTGVEYKGKTDAELATHSKFYHEFFVSCIETDEKAWKKRVLSREEKIIATPGENNKVFDIVKIPLFDVDGSRQGLVIQGHDITEPLKTEQCLRKEIIARQQTVEIMQEKSQALKEANIALRVLIKNNNDIAGEVQQSILTQLQKAVLPYITLLRQSTQNKKEKEYLDIIRNHLSEVGSPFIKKINNPTLGLTKKEILVADLVRQGKKTKEIADLLNIQPPSVETYRNRIRKKMHLNKKRISLYQYLKETFASN
jgi:PAS domain S-box-containing protein